MTNGSRGSRRNAREALRPELRRSLESLRRSSRRQIRRLARKPTRSAPPSERSRAPHADTRKCCRMRTSANAPATRAECALTKSFDLKFFRMRTYKKRPGGHTQHGGRRNNAVGRGPCSPGRAHAVCEWPWGFSSRLTRDCRSQRVWKKCRSVTPVSTGRQGRQDHRASRDRRQDHHGTLDRRRLPGRAPYIWPSGRGSGIGRYQC